MLIHSQRGTRDNIWHRATLQEIADLRLSNVDKKSRQNERRVLLCNYMDVYKNSCIHDAMSFMEATASDRQYSRCALKVGDVVITKDSEKSDDIGVPSFVRDDVVDLVCGYHLAILRPDTSRLDGRFLYFALCADEVKWQFHAFANGITRFGIRKADIQLVEIPLPSIPEQRAIAHTLGTLDDKIELNRRTNETLEEMARTLFKSWFVDFDPVRAKMEGRDTGLPTDIADLFPDRMIDSELGEIPEGWEVLRLSDLARHHTESTAPFRYPKQDFQHFSIPAYDANKCPRVELGAAIKSNKTVIPSNSVLLSKLNPRIGRVWLPSDFVGLPQVCSTEFLAFTPREPVGRGFLFALFHDRGFHALLRSLVTGTSKSHQRVQPAALKQYAVVAGSRPVLACFGETTNNLLARTLAHRLETSTLAALRDTLLPKLLSGEIRVPDAERILERVS